MERRRRRFTDVQRLARSRAEVPEAALAALESGLIGSDGRALAAEMRAVVAARRSSESLPQASKANIRRRLQGAWAYGVMLKDPRPGPAARAAMSYLSGQALDALATCLPALDAAPEGSADRAALERAVAFLDVAAAIEPVAFPQPPRHGRDSLIREAQAWSESVSEGLSVAWRSFEGALAAAPDIAPWRREGPPPRGAVRIPPVGVAWRRDLRPPLSGLLRAGHGLALAECRASVRDGRARIDLTLARDGMQAVIRVSYGSAEPRVRTLLAAGLPGSFLTGTEDEMHDALHDARGDGPTERALARVLRGLDHESPGFAVTADDDGLRLTTLPGVLDAGASLRALDGIEAAADAAGIPLVLGLSGQGAPVRSLLARGYAYAGNEGETLMRRGPAPAPGTPVP